MALGCIFRSGSVPGADRVFGCDPRAYGTRLHVPFWFGSGR
jgi:hypothetical protein